MGTGRIASDCSRFVLESLYQLLRVGLTPPDAITSMNAALPLNIPSECFSTVDLAVFDLLKGRCSIYKAGGAPSIVQRGEQAGILKMPARVSYTHLDVYKRQSTMFVFPTSNASNIFVLLRSGRSIVLYMSSTAYPIPQASAQIPPNRSPSMHRLWSCHQPVHHSSFCSRIRSSPPSYFQNGD